MMTSELDRLRLLAAYDAVLSAPGFTVGAWAGGKRDASGVIQMPYFIYSDTVDSFRRDVSAAGWVHPFDWPAWARTNRAKQLLGSPDAIATATPDDLGRLLTTMVRGDRFSEGALAEAFERGLVQAIVRRAATLVRAAEDSPEAAGP